MGILRSALRAAVFGQVEGLAGIEGAKESISNTVTETKDNFKTAMDADTLSGKTAGLAKAYRDTGINGNSNDIKLSGVMAQPIYSETQQRPVQQEKTYDDYLFDYL